MMNLIAALKGLDTNRLQLDELLVLSMQATQLRAEYANHSITTPDWLEDAARLLLGEITQRNRDNMLAQLRQLEAQERALMTRDERKANVAEQKARLHKALGLVVTEQPATVGEG